MKVTAKRLELRIAEYDRALREMMAARENMRTALRVHLDSFDERGELIVIARKLHISQSHISNLKHGYGAPSVETAREVLKATA